MASESPIKTITEMSAVANTSEVTDQSGECMVSNAGYNHVCYVKFFIYRYHQIIACNSPSRTLLIKNITLPFGLLVK